MLKSSLIISLCLLAFIGCKEVPPEIDFTEPVIGLLDSTYITSSIPVAQHKAILLEDITGVRCINCPDAAIKAHDILLAKSEDSVVVLALYPLPPLLETFTTPYDGVPKLGLETSRLIVDGLGAPSGLPNGYVDRTFFSGSSTRPINISSWASNINKQLRLSTPVNIELKRTYDAGTRELTVIATITYTSAPPANQKLNLVLSESNIVSKQLTSSGVNPAYVHNHALRYSFTPALGAAFSTPLVAGRVFVKEFKYILPADFVAVNCNIACFITEVGSDNVVNVRQIPVK
ncbi:MAG: Omp28-related outer membrane protein [Bacteroidia bacterium]|nr:Omp28-related outer membrane protein [Bacteroidia bacterium]